jgi:hypothetical protein
MERQEAFNRYYRDRFGKKMECERRVNCNFRVSGLGSQVEG